MRRMVVTTARGHVVSDVEVTEQKLAEGVARWMQVVPDCTVAIDGVLVSDEVRRALHAEATPPAVVPPPAAPLQPEQLRSAAEAMEVAYSGVVKGWLDLLGFAQDFTKKYGEQFLEQQRRSADEAARQRELTHKSLKDIDLLDRSVAATTFKDKLAAAAAAHGTVRAGRDDSMRLRDAAMGVLKLIVGDKK